MGKKRRIKTNSKKFSVKFANHPATVSTEEENTTEVYIPVRETSKVEPIKPIKEIKPSKSKAKTASKSKKKGFWSKNE